MGGGDRVATYEDLFGDSDVRLPLPSERKLIEPDVHEFETGAVRSKDADNTRYDLITPIGLRRVAEAYAEGATKYSDFNWEKGMPITGILNHAIRHIFLYLSGDRSEDHLGHAGWNVLAACHSEEMWPHLNEYTLRGLGCTPPQDPPECPVTPTPPIPIPSEPIPK